MDGKLRVILFVLLVTLFSVRGQDFRYYQTAYKHIKEFENKNGVLFNNAENLRFVRTDVEQQWVANTVADEQMQGILITPVDPGFLGAAIVESGNDGEETKYLSHMLICFSKINYLVPRPAPNEMETCYGIFAMCFKNRERDTHESCVQTLMFSYPSSKRQRERAGIHVCDTNPISPEQLNEIIWGRPFSWALKSFNSVISEVIETCTLHTDIPEASRRSNLAKYLQQGKTAYLLNPIIVDEWLLREYFALATL